MTNSIVITANPDTGAPEATAGRMSPSQVVADQAAAAEPVKGTLNFSLADDQVPEGVSGVKSVADLQRSIMDPRYKTDASYRAQVHQLARSQLTGAQLQPDGTVKHAQGEQTQQATDDTLAPNAPEGLEEGAAEIAETHLVDSDVEDWQSTMVGLEEAMGAPAAEAAVDAMVDGVTEGAMIDELINQVGLDTANAIYAAGEEFIGRACLTIGAELGMTPQQIQQAVDFIDGNAVGRGIAYKAALRGDFSHLGQAMQATMKARS